MGQEHVAREDATWGARERGQDLELHERRLDLVAAHAHAALGEVDPQAVDLERRLVVRVISARRSAALTRERNSRIENGLVM
jgi:hypothetical protein